MPYEPRFTRDLRDLLATQRVAALGTLGDDGMPFVSMVPYALEPRSPYLVIHVSELAAHTRNLQARPRVSLLVMQAEVAGEPVHALPRVTLEGHAMVRAVGLCPPGTYVRLDNKEVAVVMRRSSKANHPHVAIVINEAGTLLNPPRLHRTANGSPGIKSALAASAVRERLNHYLILQLGAYAAQHP